MENYSTTFTVSQPPAIAFKGITNVRGWWSEGLEGASEEQGDEFVYINSNLHYSRHRLIEVIPGKKVVWLTTDSCINFVDDKSEWTGTTINFEIIEEGSQTTVKFSHIGLVPQLACYTACTGGWKYYLESLRNLIETGKGHPDPKG